MEKIEPKISDFLNACIKQVKDAKFKPNYIKYNDGKKIVEIKLKE